MHRNVRESAGFELYEIQAICITEDAAIQKIGVAFCNLISGFKTLGAYFNREGPE
jgi:hypothetical protein